MHDIYQSPLATRYASNEMLHLFSEDHKFKTWRRLWIALAEAEHELGLPITEEQLAALRAAAETIDYDVAAAYEKKLRHDVMAHVHTYGDQCPTAKGIIHLGATSCFVTDNTDLLILRDGLALIRRQLLKTIKALRDFALRYKDLPCLGFTHYQPAQPVTLGKRAALWLQDLYFDLQDLDYVYNSLKLRGVKGTTGTQASFLALFHGDHAKVEELDRRLAAKMGVAETYPVSCQTYSRKIDFRVLAVLSGIAQSAHKFANDLRLMQNLKELEEPFEKEQIGSSAMAYKRNPMRSERMTSLARYVIQTLNNPAQTAAEQWLERTLDDSANKRIAVPESFLATDAILILYRNIASGLVVYEKMIAKHLNDELPFMATENLLMAAVERGGDRQELHEIIRQASMEAGRAVKLEGQANPLLKLLAERPEMQLKADDFAEILDAKRYTGRSAEQVSAFIGECIDPILEKLDSQDLGGESELRV